MKSYPPFSLSIGAPKNSLTKYPNHTWDYDPATRSLSYREDDHAEHHSEVKVLIFERLIVGEDVRGTAVGGGEFRLGELYAFAVNEVGVRVPFGLAPQRRVAR